MMDCVQCDCANGGTEEDIAPQRLVIRALAFGLLMLGVIEVGLGTFILVLLLLFRYIIFTRFLCVSIIPQVGQHMP